jgi:16S rRNA G527 N7-methylase RsmG
MPQELSFSVVTMRAVDKMEQALPEAAKRVQTGGSLLLLSTAGEEAKIKEPLPEMHWSASKPIPLTEQGIVLLGTKGST